MPMTDEELRAALERDGYVVVEQLLSADVIETLRERSAAVVAEISTEHRERNRSQGSLVPLADHPAYADVIGAAELGALFDRLGFVDPRFSSGYLISKPPGGPPLFWHQDWWGWQHPLSYTATIAQVFVMVYLGDTSPTNGCLRVIPGSHRARHSLHDADAAHGEALSRVDDPAHPLYAEHADEVPVPVRAGDVVVGDARLLHAAHANRSDAERSLLTLWFHPDHAALPAPLRARIRGFFDRTGVDTDTAEGEVRTLDDWPTADALRDLFPPPESAVPQTFDRVPRWDRQAGPDR